MKLALVTDQARLSDPQIFVKLYEESLDSMLRLDNPEIQEVKQPFEVINGINQELLEVPDEREIEVKAAPQSKVSGKSGFESGSEGSGVAGEIEIINPEEELAKE